MSNVTNTAAIGDAGLSLPQTPPTQPGLPPVPAIEHAADLRLIIEEDRASGSYIYKTLDRRTGEVIQQFPREEVLKLMDANAYAAGAVINAKA